MTAGENFKFIFRESKINDAILFFDECEAIFESRELGGHSVNLLLTEIERYVCVLCYSRDVVILPRPDYLPNIHGLRPTGYAVG